MFATVTLHDGRTLEYADLGEPSGTAVLFFPGTPATAGQAGIVAEAARSNGVRLVSISRPGYAASTVAPPGLSPTAEDALELLGVLGIDDVVAMGLSGGGPFALALAALAPGRVTAVQVLGGPGAHGEVNPEDLDEEDLRAIGLLAEGDVDGARTMVASWAEQVFGPMQAMTPEELHVALQSIAPPGENWFDSHPDVRPAFEADFQRGIAPVDGYVRDNLSWLGPWDFDLAAVSAPVQLVHGEGDRMVPPAHGAWLEERLPTSRRHVVPGGHGHATFGAATDAVTALGRD